MRSPFFPFSGLLQTVLALFCSRSLGRFRTFAADLLWLPLCAPPACLPLDLGQSCFQCGSLSHFVWVGLAGQLWFSWFLVSPPPCNWFTPTRAGIELEVIFQGHHGFGKPKAI
eukprot:1160225-Pelagomonas_calceolata.AAC.1